MHAVLIVDEQSEFSSKYWKNLEFVEHKFMGEFTGSVSVSSSAIVDISFLLLRFLVSK